MPPHVGPHRENEVVQLIIAQAERARFAIVDPARSSEPMALLTAEELPAAVRELEAESHPRWVWAETKQIYPALLDAGVRVERCHDLRLCAAILDRSTLTEQARAVGRFPRPTWLAPGPAEAGPALPSTIPPSGETLFDLDDLTRSVDEITVAHDSDDSEAERATPIIASTTFDSIARELERQQSMVAASADPRALRLLLAAESAGALIGAEMHAAGLPWDRAAHERVLDDALGPRPKPGFKPARVEQLAARVRAALDGPSVNLDSQADLLRALRRAGIQVGSTSRWELSEHEHPAIEPLIAYKKLARLQSANGWAWLDEWVHDGRFRPDYVPGGTATGRWATSGGGALQLPKVVRSAVVADPGWALVVADAAQLEPRVLAAMARDEAMAGAGRGRDIYRGIVDAGVVEDRAQAKVAILGAMYGATTGDSGRLVPRLAKAYPLAMALVDRAAVTGERGGVVTTNLGRSSPPPGDGWRAIQAQASQPDATPADERRARSVARDWGRFTRNFVVQGSAAEWALCWMAALRPRLAQFDSVGTPAERSGPVFARMPHLVYFLHDEIIVHTPREYADEVATAVRETAHDAGRLLFGDFPVDFPLDLAIVDSYSMADS